MTMDVSLALLADYANVSREGKLNVMGIFNAAFVEELPGTLSPCVLVLKLEADPAEKGSHKEVQFRLVDPDGKVIVENSLHLQIERDEQPGSARFDFVLPCPLRFEQYGPHRLSILVNGETKTGIEIAALPPPPPPSEAG